MYSMKSSVLWISMCLVIVQDTCGLYSMAKLHLNERSIQQCPPCNTHTCSIVLPDDCPGRIIKDDCDCCPLCDTSEPPATVSTFNQTYITEEGDPEACKQIECPRNQMCLLNIQDIPVCRCPSSLYCKDRPKKEICSDEDQTYRSICYLKMASCESSKKITVKHKGPCKQDVEDRKERKRLKEVKRQERIQRKKSKKKKPRKVIRGDPVKKKKKKNGERISSNNKARGKKRQEIKEKNQKSKSQIKQEIRKERRRHRRRLRKILLLEKD